MERISYKYNAYQNRYLYNRWNKHLNVMKCWLRGEQGENVW